MMGMKAVTGVLLGLTAVLVAWVPIQAQESNSPEPAKAAAPESKGDQAEPPKAAAPESKDGEQRSGKAELEALNELVGRREKARGELQLLDAQIAVKRAEAQKAHAEIQVFLLQHPSRSESDVLKSSDPAVDDALRSDPEVAALMARIDHARERDRDLARKTRFPDDPSRKIVSLELRALEERLKVLYARKKYQLLERLMTTGETPPAPSQDVIGRKLDQLIEEVGSLQRALLREPRKP